MATATAEIEVWTAEDLLKHWQGHRRVTRKTIEAFPEDKLFHFSVGGMRPFSDLVSEFIGMAVPVVEGVATGNWKKFEGGIPTSKSGLLVLWDEQTAALDAKFPQIPAHRFVRSTRLSACGRGQECRPSSTPWTTKFTIAARAMSTCVFSESSHRTSGNASNFDSMQNEAGPAKSRPAFQRMCHSDDPDRSEGRKNPCDAQSSFGFGKSHHIWQLDWIDEGHGFSR